MSGRYDSGEFDQIKYMSTSGGLGSAESDARISYYGVTGYPTLVWQGTIYNVGAGSDVVDGAPYDVIVNSLLPSATPVALRITDFVLEPPSPSVTIEVELEDDLADISQMKIRAFVVEDNITYSPRIYNDVMRDMVLQVPLTISQAGQTQQITQPFAWDPLGQNWRPEYLRLVAMVQDDRDRSVLQSCNSQPTPDYAFRYYCLGDRVALASGVHAFDEFALFNTGTQADTYDLTLDMSELPPDWNGWITDGVNQFSSVQVSLNPGERAFYYVVMASGSSGGGKLSLILHSQGERTADRRVSYQMITPDTEVLLVDDDGAESFETDYFAPAITAAGRTYAIWDRNINALTAPVLSNFNIVVWNVGWAFPSVDATDRAALAGYLDGGGHLFITGQDIGWDLDDQGGAALVWYHQYLHANFINDDTNDYTLSGVAGDPISDGLSIVISGGDGANNQQYPSDIDPYDATASIIFTYDTTRNGAIKADTGVYKVVYFAFGYEAINNATDRAVVMQRVLDWLYEGVSAAPDTPGPPLVLAQNTPNPFNPRTVIRFDLGRESRVRLEVFDVAGRLVRVLQDGRLPAGNHVAAWDGRDDHGRQLSSGTYFYRLDDGDQELTRKMLMLR